MLTASQGMHPLLVLLANPDQRESALYHLSKNRDIIAEISSDLMNPCTFTENNVTSNEQSKRICALDALLFLMRSRYNTNLHTEIRRLIVRETNALYRGGLGINLMKSISDGFTHLKISEKHISTDICLRKICDCLFFMFYGTQILEDEVRSLVVLIKTISDSLVDTETPEIIEDWKSSAYAVLSVLQLTHVSALDQANSLLQRAVDDIKPSEDDVNALRQVPGSREGLDMTWRSKGAKGLACLANAVLRQPSVDCNTAPAADVVWFLKEAADMRAYSYIRLCLLPVLQCSFLKDEDNFYITVLCELLRKIAHIFHIYELARNADRQYFLRSTDLALARSGSRGSPMIHSDCLDDVMHLFAAVCNVMPSFAETFRFVDAAGASALHPFIMTSLDASDRQPCLVLPAMRLLAGVGSGLDGTTAASVHQLLRGNRHARLKWDHLFFCIESFAKQMGGIVQQASSSIPGSGPVVTPTASARAMPLNPKDEEGLQAIVDLIEVCVRDKSVADNIHQKYDPVRKLFSLLACPIPITLKGTVFRALSSLARNCAGAAEAVWESIELYRLLPARGNGGPQGLRFELEATESKAGVYPSTEGFLQLLDALLETYDTPDTLGLGYRRPGLMVYLEFVIDDVLLRAHERFYAPEGTHQGMTQRWRLTARSLKILSSIMQHYNINNLPAGTLHSLSSTLRDDANLQAIVADFREETAVYKVEDLPDQKCPRPKTLGFSLMALLLGRCRLLDRLLSLLGECSVAALDAEKEIQGLEFVKNTIEIFATMQQPRKSPVGLNGYGAMVRSEEIDLELDLSIRGFNEEALSCDGSYWMEKTVSNCIGLLYECSLRESRFLELLRSAPPLTILRSEGGCTTSLPVMVRGGLEDALSSSLALGTVAHFLTLPCQRWHSVPCVPVMVTRLLEHVSASQTSDRFMSAMRSTPEEEEYLMAGCVRAVLEGDESETSSIFKEIFPLGSDRHPDVFTQSVSSSGSPPDIPEILKLAVAGTVEPLETVRGALLSLILKSLHVTPDRLCLSHQLLGVRDAIKEGNNGNNLPELSRLRRNINGYLPSNCLQAILSLITPSDPEQGVISSPSLIQQQPELACVCYEIIYHLCSSPISSAITLGHLRSSNVQFLKLQIQEILRLATLSDEALCIPDGNTDRITHSQVEAVKAARHTCTAYVLQIFALEVRDADGSQIISRIEVQDLLDLLFSIGTNVYRESVNIPRELPIMSILRLSLDLPILSLPSITSPLIIRCLSAAAVPFYVSRKGVASTTGYTTISISLFTKLVKDECNAVAAMSPAGARNNSAVSAVEFQEALKGAIMMNVYNKRAAASAHLCSAWGQAVDVSVYGFGSRLLPERIDDSERENYFTPMPGLMSEIALPILQALSIVPLEMPMAEQLVKSVLSIISTLQTNGDSNIHRSLSVNDSQTILTALTRALLRRAGGRGVPRTSSLLYRGFLYSGIIRVINGSLQGVMLQDGRGGSDEGKGGEMRGYNHSDDAMALDQCSAELADTLGTDAASGPPIWRVVALSTLSTVLTLLGPTRDTEGTRTRDSRHCRGAADIYGSPSGSYLQALHALSQRGHISSIMECIGSTNSSADSNFSDPGSQELFESAVSFCVAMANTKEGGAILLENGFLARVCSLKFFRTPPPSAEEISPFGKNGTSLREEALKLMESRLSPVLRVLRCLCSVSSSQSVVEGAVKFLQLNHLLVTYLLRLRFQTLKGLALTESVMALMTLVVASGDGVSKQARYSKDDTPSVQNKGFVWGMLGSMGDTFVCDACALLKLLGGELIPSPTSTRFGYSVPSDTGSGWWASFSPSSIAEFEMHEKQIGIPLTDGSDSGPNEEFRLETPPSWTIFDQKKLNLGLRVTSLAAAFLRRRSGTSENSSFCFQSAADGGLLAIDFDAVAATFITCAGLCRPRGAYPSMQWLMNPYTVDSSSSMALSRQDHSSADSGVGVDSALPALQFIVENLICVLHNMNSAASAPERACWALSLNKCVCVTERDFPSHSFVKQVGRWIRDQMNHET